jgi:diadenosine tetraphosphate (Ap4A) HIT family hydrolase
MKTKDFLGNEWDIDCMGCEISTGSMMVPGGMIKRTQNFCIHQDPLIPLPGFLVIGSVRHIRSISEMQESEYEEFSKIVKIAHQAIKGATKETNLTIVQEESSEHFHLWFFPWTERVIEKYGQPTLTKIREIMFEYREQEISEAEWKKLEKSIGKIKKLMVQLEENSSKAT